MGFTIVLATELNILETYSDWIIDFYIRKYQKYK